MPDAWVMGVGDSTASRYVGTETGLSQALVYLRNRSGGSLFLSPGTFMLSSGLTIDTSNVRLVGCGASTILTAPTATMNLITVNNSATEVSIESLQLQGQATDETFTQRGISVSGSAGRVRMRNLLFSGSTASNGLNVGIHLNADSDNNLIADNRFQQVIGTNSGFGYVILVETSDSNRIVRNHSVLGASQGRHHIYLSAGSSYNIVADNRCESGLHAQITFSATDPQAACQFNEIVGNIVSGMDTGASATEAAIELTGKSYFNAVRGNVVVSSGRNGIKLEGGAAAADRPSDNQIVGNYVFRPQQYGIQLLGSTRSVVSNNTIFEANQVAGAYGAINLQRSNGVAVVSAKVIGNTVLGATHNYALDIDAGPPVATNAEVIGNSFSAGTSGTYTDNATTTVGKANTLSGGDPAISVASTATMAIPDGIGEFYTVTGTADITSITASWRGRRVTLLFSGTAATNGVVDGSNLKLASTLAYTPDDTITLVCDGTNWYETARSVN